MKSSENSESAATAHLARRTYLRKLRRLAAYARLKTVGEGWRRGRAGSVKEGGENGSAENRGDNRRWRRPGGATVASAAAKYRVWRRQRLGGGEIIGQAASAPWRLRAAKTVAGANVARKNGRLAAGKRRANGKRAIEANGGRSTSRWFAAHASGDLLTHPAPAPRHRCSCAHPLSAYYHRCHHYLFCPRTRASISAARHLRSMARRACTRTMVRSGVEQIWRRQSSNMARGTTGVRIARALATRAAWWRHPLNLGDVAALPQRHAGERAARCAHALLCHLCARFLALAARTKPAAAAAHNVCVNARCSRNAGAARK
jgi:hypothetical protein